MNEIDLLRRENARLHQQLGGGRDESYPQKEQASTPQYYSIAESLHTMMSRAEDSNEQLKKMQELHKLLEKHKDVMRILELTRELGLR